jgi:hypothetical protein
MCRHSFCHTMVGMEFKFDAESSNFLLKLEDLEFLKHSFFYLVGTVFDKFLDKSVA